jgi:hypothetical protein
LRDARESREYEDETRDLTAEEIEEILRKHRLMSDETRKQILEKAKRNLSQDLEKKGYASTMFTPEQMSRILNEKVLRVTQIAHENIHVFTLDIQQDTPEHEVMPNDITKAVMESSLVTLAGHITPRASTIQDVSMRDNSALVVDTSPEEQTVLMRTCISQDEAIKMLELNGRNFSRKELMERGDVLLESYLPSFLIQYAKLLETGLLTDLDRVLLSVHIDEANFEHTRQLGDWSLTSLIFRHEKIRHMKNLYDRGTNYDYVRADVGWGSIESVLQAFEALSIREFSDSSPSPDLTRHLPHQETLDADTIRRLSLARQLRRLADVVEIAKKKSSSMAFTDFIVRCESGAITHLHELLGIGYYAKPTTALFQVGSGASIELSKAIQSEPFYKDAHTKGSNYQSSASRRSIAIVKPIVELVNNPSVDQIALFSQEGCSRTTILGYSQTSRHVVRASSYYPNGYEMGMGRDAQYCSPIRVVHLTRSESDLWLCKAYEMKKERAQSYMQFYNSFSNADSSHLQLLEHFMTTTTSIGRSLDTEKLSTVFFDEGLQISNSERIDCSTFIEQFFGDPFAEGTTKLVSQSKGLLLEDPLAYIWGILGVPLRLNANGIAHAGFSPAENPLVAFDTKGTGKPSTKEEFMELIKARSIIQTADFSDLPDSMPDKSESTAIYGKALLIAKYLSHEIEISESITEVAWRFAGILDLMRIGYVVRAGHLESIKAYKAGTVPKYLSLHRTINGINLFFDELSESSSELRQIHESIVSVNFPHELAELSIIKFRDKSVSQIILDMGDAAPSILPEFGKYEKGSVNNWVRLPTAARFIADILEYLRIPTRWEDYPSIMNEFQNVSNLKIRLREMSQELIDLNSLSEMSNEDCFKLEEAISKTRELKRKIAETTINTLSLIDKGIKSDSFRNCLSELFDFRKIIEHMCEIILLTKGGLITDSNSNTGKHLDANGMPLKVENVLSGVATETALSMLSFLGVFQHYGPNIAELNSRKYSILLETRPGTGRGGDGFSVMIDDKNEEIFRRLESKGFTLNRRTDLDRCVVNSIRNPKWYSLDMFYQLYDSQSLQTVNLVLPAAQPVSSDIIQKSVLKQTLTNLEILFIRSLTMAKSLGSVDAENIRLWESKRQELASFYSAVFGKKMRSSLSQSKILPKNVRYDVIAATALDEEGTLLLCSTPLITQLSKHGFNLLLSPTTKRLLRILGWTSP